MNINLDYLPLETRNLLEKFSKKAFIKKFYLAGGTAVALFFNHRRSEDLDFFSEQSFRTPTLIRDLKDIGTFQSFKSAQDTCIGVLDDIKVSFFSLPYKLLERPLHLKYLPIAQPLDLAAMKILAISDRGTKRDFIDLYVLCQKIKSLDDFLCFFQKKFGKYDYNIYHVIRSLTYFEDAEKDEMPRMNTNITWKAVKNFFIQEKPKLAKKFLRV